MYDLIGVELFDFRLLSAKLISWKYYIRPQGNAYIK